MQNLIMYLLCVNVVQQITGEPYLHFCSVQCVVIDMLYCLKAACECRNIKYVYLLFSQEQCHLCTVWWTTRSSKHSALMPRLWSWRWCSCHLWPLTSASQEKCVFLITSLLHNNVDCTFIHKDKQYERALYMTSSYISSGVCKPGRHQVCFSSRRQEAGPYWS